MSSAQESSIHRPKFLGILRLEDCVLVTGCAGPIGRAICAGLNSAGVRIRGFDRQVRPPSLLPDASAKAFEYVQGDLSEKGSIRAALTGCTMVVHLAAVPDDPNFGKALTPGNDGLHNLLDVCRGTQVKRLVFGSSAKMFSAYTDPSLFPIKVTDPPKADSMGDTAEMVLEGAAQTFASSPEGCPTVVLRFAWYPFATEDVDAMRHDTRPGQGRNQYMSPGDAGRAVLAALTTNLGQRAYVICLVQSNPSERGTARFDVGPTKEILGWEPQDTYPTGLDWIQSDYVRNQILQKREQERAAGSGKRAAQSLKDERQSENMHVESVMNIKMPPNPRSSESFVRTKVASDVVAKEEATSSRKAQLAQILQGMTKEKEQMYTEKLLPMVSENHFQDLSTEIGRCLADNRPDGQVPWVQDPIYTGAGLQGVVQKAESTKAKFDDFSIQIAEVLTYFSGAACSYMDGPLKSMGRSAEKVNIKYLGDATKLTDAVRGTIVVEVTSEEVLPHIYGFFAALVSGKGEIGKKLAPIMKAAGAHIKHFDDRYIKPLGTYRDWLFLVDVQGFLTELQVNFDVAIAKKEGEDHQRYEKSREAEQRLLQSCMQHDVEGAQKALRDGADAGNARLCDANGFTPLHYSAFFGERDLTMSLLEHKANPFATDYQGTLPFVRAVVQDHQGVVQCLVEVMEKGRRQLSSLSDGQKKSLLSAWCIDAKNAMPLEPQLYKLLCWAVPSRDTQLYYAASLGLSDAFPLIFKKGQCEVNLDQKAPKLLARYFPEATEFVWPLDVATIVGSVETVRACLDLGGQFRGDPNPDQLNAPHAHPHKAAMRYVERDAFKQLSALIAVDVQKPQHGARDGDSMAHLRDKDTMCKNLPWGQAPGTPLCMEELVAHAVAHRAFRSLDVLVDHGASLSATNVENACVALHKEAEVGNIAGIEQLLRLQVPVDALDSEGHTALLKASDTGEEMVCKVLIEAKADVNVRTQPTDHSQPVRFPLRQAAFIGRLGVLRLLVAARADIEQVDRLGATAAYSAAQRGHTAILEVLQECEADLDKASDTGVTPLLIAAENDHADSVEFLIAAKANVNHQKSDGFTAMHRAALFGSPSAMEVLCKAGADVDKVDDKGRTPLWYAAIEKHTDCVSHLIEAKADVNHQDPDGFSVALAAAAQGCLAILKALHTAGADFRKASNGGETPMSIAKELEHHDCVSFLESITRAS